MLKELRYLLCGTVLVFLVPACQQKHARNFNKLWVDDTGLMFFKSGIESGFTEVRASALAKSHSHNKMVINLARMIIDDHGKSIDKLKKLAAEKQVDEKDSVSTVHQQAINELAKTMYGNFDKAYLKMMIASHEEKIKLFTTASHNADPDISRLANKTLPLIKAHLDAAGAVLSSIK